MKSNEALKQVCRYSYMYYPQMTITQCLNVNPWLFNQSYNIMAFYNSNITIPQNIFKPEQNWITDNFVLFSGTNDTYESYKDKMNWDDFGTWYINLYPAEIKCNKSRIIGLESVLPRVNKDKLEDYFNLNEDWMFIHEMQADLFISKQKKGIVIGSISELNLMCIDKKDQTKSKHKSK
jgi:hypothetical protein